MAGLTVWAVLVPEALAYATIAGVSPVVGLYAAPAALVFYAALGELADALAAEGADLRLAGVRRPAAGTLSRSGVAERVTIAPTVDAAVHHPPG